MARKRIKSCGKIRSRSKRKLLSGRADKQKKAHPPPKMVAKGKHNPRISINIHKINAEPKKSALTEAQQSQLAEALAALNRRDSKAARRILERLGEAVPNDPSIWLNLARACEIEGQQSERLRLLEHAISIDPGYLMGRCVLAMYATLHDDVARARELLADLHHRNEMHIQEAINLYGTHAVVDALCGEAEHAMALLDTLEPIAEEYGETGSLEQFRQLAILNGARHIALSSKKPVIANR